MGVDPALRAPRPEDLFDRLIMAPPGEMPKTVECRAEPTGGGTRSHASEIRSQVLRGGGLLVLAEGSSLLLGFMRNVITARLLLPADFGIAATFTLTMQFMEMLSDLGADKLLVQCDPEEAIRLQRLSQLLAVFRGAAMGAAILVLAGPIASLFGHPEVAWAYRCLALIPLLRGLAHQDLVRIQRGMRFARPVSAQIAGSLGLTVAAIPLAWWLRDYRALLWVLVIDSLTRVVLSHLLSEHPYRWRWNRQEARRLLSFGWPLLLNGLLMFGTLQGDRLIIGAGYTMADLGMFAVAMTLAALPVSICSRVSSSLLLPTLARVRREEDRFVRTFRLAQQGLALVSGAMAVLLIVLGPAMITLLYGQKYAAAGTLIGLLAISQTLRLMRFGPTIAAMARGDSRNSLIANAGRSIGIPASLLAVWMGMPLTWVAGAAVLGEAVALLVSAAGLRWRHGQPMGIVLGPGAMYATMAALAAVAASLAVGWLQIVLLSMVVLGLLFAGMMLVFSDLRVRVVLPGIKAGMRAVQAIGE